MPMAPLDSLPYWHVTFGAALDTLRLNPHIIPWVFPSLALEVKKNRPGIETLLAIFGVALSFATVMVLFGQKRIGERQARIAQEQTEIAKRQIALQEESRRERLREAIGRFCRTAHDLASELKKADHIDELGEEVGVDWKAHPRQVLRNASLEFAPLGDRAVQWLNELGAELDRYYEDASSWNADNRDYRGTALIVRIDEHRRRIGTLLDRINGEIPLELRDLQYGGGDEFRRDVYEGERPCLDEAVSRSPGRAFGASGPPPTPVGSGARLTGSSWSAAGPAAGRSSISRLGRLLGRGSDPGRGAGPCFPSAARRISAGIPPGTGPCAHRSIPLRGSRDTTTHTPS